MNNERLTNKMKRTSKTSTVLSESEQKLLRSNICLKTKRNVSNKPESYYQRLKNDELFL